MSFDLNNLVYKGASLVTYNKLYNMQYSKVLVDSFRFRCTVLALLLVKPYLDPKQVLNHLNEDAEGEAVSLRCSYLYNFTVILLTSK